MQQHRCHARHCGTQPFSDCWPAALETCFCCTFVSRSKISFCCTIDRCPHGPAAAICGLRASWNKGDTCHHCWLEGKIGVPLDNLGRRYRSMGFHVRFFPPMHTSTAGPVMAGHQCDMLAALHVDCRGSLPAPAHVPLECGCACWSAVVSIATPSIFNHLVKQSICGPPKVFYSVKYEWHIMVRCPY